MTDYNAPLRDMRFVLNDLVGMDRISALPGSDHVGSDLTTPSWRKHRLDAG